ncbi:MAG: single-stranded-DNA-specific exonuclease RecJ [Patescibacteria group bacterium]
MGKTWQCTEAQGAEKITLQKYPELHPIAARMLARRNIFEEQEIENFFNPNWETGVPDPFLFAHMHEAVDRIFLALEKGERIVIHGDYDADGVTGSAVLAEAIKMLKSSASYDVPRTTYHVQSSDEQKFFTILAREDSGMDLDVYIPHREREGYGLNMESVELIIQSKANLLITVDCGVANVNEIAKARAAGMDVIVVDHHQHGEVLPDAILIHPGLPGEKYPFKNLAAVGVAWKVACALAAEARARGFDVPAGWEKWLLDLVSIATITDIVPLKGENRVLEKYGLVVLNKLRRPGIKALLEVANWKKGELDSETIGFVIGPRINAAGRMEHAFMAVDMLLEERPEQAASKALALESINKSRQKATEQMMKEAENMSVDHSMHSIIVAWSEKWSPSLVGLAAGRYTDKFGKPAIFVGKFGNTWIGSGRSIPEYDITSAVRDAGGSMLLRYGGHHQACGFSLEKDEYLDLLAIALRGHAAKALELENLKPRLKIEDVLRLEDLDWKLIQTLLRFEPYGEGNPKPIFMSQNLSVIESALVGATQNHVKCVLQEQTGKRQKFIGFYKADLLPVFQTGQPVDIVYDVSVSEWNGRKEIQCKLIDVRLSS